MQRKKQVRTETRHTVELDAQDLLECLAPKLNIPPEILHRVKLYVEIPGGGDWSNTDLSISSESPLKISWVTVEEDTEASVW